MIHVIVIRKVSKTWTKQWVSSFFEKTFYQELVSLLCVGVYFEGWVRILELLFFTSHNLREF
jgi:hypothetical protein